jgi:hypothetical protein
MSLDRKGALLENLDIIARTYLKLIVLKQLEQDSCDNGRYQELHELSESERLLVEDINGLLKCIVPDLVAHRSDDLVRFRMDEIDGLQTSLVRKSLGLTGSLRERVVRTAKSLEKLNLLPKSSSFARPNIVNIRA